MKHRNPYGSVAVSYRSRPNYPRGLFEWLKDQVSECEIAWDCGCGSGQGSHDLAKNFRHVIATDISNEQILQATDGPRVVFRCAPEKASGIEDNSVDLICSFMAAHWFNLDDFYHEARRVSKPNAIIALLVYGEPYIGSNKIIDQSLARIAEQISPYGGPAIQRMRDRYEKLYFPFADERVLPKFELSARMTANDLLLYFASRASIIDYTSVHGDTELQLLTNLLRSTYRDNEEFTVKWPLYGRVAAVRPSNVVSRNIVPTRINLNAR